MPARSGPPASCKRRAGSPASGGNGSAGTSSGNRSCSARPCPRRRARTRRNAASQASQHCRSCTDRLQEFPVYCAMTCLADAPEIHQQKYLAAAAEGLHVVNLEPVTIGPATGAAPSVAAQCRTARTPPRLRSVQARQTSVIHLDPSTPGHRPNGAGASRSGGHSLAGRFATSTQPIFPAISCSVPPSGAACRCVGASVTVAERVQHACGGATLVTGGAARHRTGPAASPHPRRAAPTGHLNGCTTIRAGDTEP